jgi:hypothetical protein
VEEETSAGVGTPLYLEHPCVAHFITDKALSLHDVAEWVADQRDACE